MDIIRVKNNPTIPFISGNDILFIYDLSSDTDCKVTPDTLKVYVLGGHVIGGTSAGDIVDIDTIQTLLNKRLNSPKINSNTAVTSTSEEINKLHGLAATTGELNLTHTYASKIPFLANATSDLQTQINALRVNNRTITYGLTFTGVTTKEIKQEDIISELNINTGFAIDLTSIICTLAQVSGSTYSYLKITGGSDPSITYTKKSPINQVNQLDKITIGNLSSSNTYNFAMTFSLINKVPSGGT